LDCLYPEIEPYFKEAVKVSDLHTIYVERVGNPKGKPVVFLHGGPGGGINSTYRRFFNPQDWNITLFDQRGCGRSMPHAELRENTTWDLVADIEKLRTRYGVESWTVFGGSWGSTLALAYAETHPQRCDALILRGIFLCRRWELEWFYQKGTSHLFPDYFQPYEAIIPVAERKDMIRAYYQRLTSENRQERMRAAIAWSQWEAATSRLVPDAERIAEAGQEKFAEAFARIECHYFVNGCFFETDDQLLRDAHRLNGIPGVIVHGRYDVVCPIQNAWELKSRWRDTELQIIDTSGHSMTEDGIAKALVAATDRFGKAQ
jgi:proline iminopeptidase